MNQKVADTYCSKKRSRLDNQDTDELSIKRVLARVEALEGKCVRLETKCKYLENRLHETQSHQQQQQPQAPSIANEFVSSIISHIDSKFHRLDTSINSKLHDLDHSTRWLEALHKNQEWKYGAPTIPISYWVSRGFDEEYVQAADSFLEDLETITCAMRRGECNDSYVHLGFGERFDEIDNAYLVYDVVMQRHWTEFVDALGQYQWHLNRSSMTDDDSTFIVSDVQIPSELCYLLERNLPNNHFKRITFQNNQFGRFGISLAIKCIEKNPKLIEFMVSENAIEAEEDAKRMCQAVNNHPTLEIFSVKRSCDAFGHDIMCSIMHDECKLECIDLPGNSIRTNGSRHIADFLAKNPPLRELTLEDNLLDDDDAEAIAEALKTNTNLKTLILRGNLITKRGEDALQKVLADYTSLNAAAACNHTCTVYLNDSSSSTIVDESPDPRMNRGEKIYSILSIQAGALNANSLGSTVSSLPVALESIQKYAKYSLEKKNAASHHHHAPALSIVYDIVRNKAPELYSPNNELAKDTSFDDILPCVSGE